MEKRRKTYCSIRHEYIKWSHHILAHHRGIFQTPLPALTERVDANQYKRAKKETASCNTGQADHSNLSGSSSAATPPLCSLEDSTVWANEHCCECRPATALLSEKPQEQRQRGSSDAQTNSSLACICTLDFPQVVSARVPSRSLVRRVATS